MKHRIYCINDLTAAHFSAPFIQVNDGTAKRLLAELVSDPQSKISKTPEDYNLVFLGDYDDETGIVTACTPTPVINARALLKDQS